MASASVSAALVSADDERALARTLEELADLEGVSWSVYRGPLWVELEVPVAVGVADRRGREGSPLRRSDLRLGDTAELLPGALEASAAACGTGRAMVEEVYRQAFPGLHRALYGAGGEGALRGALEGELRRLLDAHRRMAARSRRRHQAGALAAPGHNAARVARRRRAEDRRG